MNNFANLSPYDFESLCRDLFAAVFDDHFEMFAAGRDGGIDLRYIGNGTAASPDLVIQCKHYAGSGFSALKSKMKASRQQAIGLKAKRYILATTVSMSPEKKTELMDELRPLIASEDDIFSKEDIDSLLRTYPQVEKSHFRLWLNSTAILEQVLHASVFSQTDVYLEQLEYTARTFVDNSGVADVLALLEQKHVCIISGPAGVGKTTLANMLLIYYVDQGFQPIIVSENFSEAQQVYSKQNKQIFLYDDFLGRTTGVEKLGKNEDARLSHFIDAISRAPSKRFLLTTRQHILEQAGERHEALGRPHIKHVEYFFKMKAYSKTNKAHILYNHLYFSNLSKEHKVAIVDSRRYSTMIASKNFTPRAVELAVALALENEKSPEEIAEFLVDSLEDPSELWRNQLTRQMSHSQRVILAFLALEGGSTPKGTLEKFYLSSPHAFQERQSFDAAMRGLEGSAIELRSVAGTDAVFFSNPGVEDAVLDHLLPMRNVLQPLIGELGYKRCLVLWNHANDTSSQRDRRRHYSVKAATGLAPRAQSPLRMNLQVVVDSLLPSFISQLLQGMTAGWDRGGVNEEHLSNVLLMSREVTCPPELTTKSTEVATRLAAFWDAGEGTKSLAGYLLDVLLEKNDILNEASRNTLISSAISFISDDSGESPEDFYAMFALAELFETGRLTNANSKSAPLELQTVQELAEAAAVAEWDSLAWKSNLHNMREEIDSWRDLLDDLGIPEPDEYQLASEIVNEAELRAEGYDEGWDRESSFRDADSDKDIHVLFSSLAD